jgi:hypothetical protein
MCESGGQAARTLANHGNNKTATICLEQLFRTKPWEEDEVLRQLIWSAKNTPQSSASILTESSRI